ncbi:MAG: O-antigen ligase family protein [Bacteroidetes bacterium]|nr:O-antigen ligase family protein [Bacteroidota bacterium]
MAASLSLGKFFLGGSIFFVCINWGIEGTRVDPIWIHYRGRWKELTIKSFFTGLLEENFKPKWRLFRARPSIAILMGVVILHLIGMIWTPDAHEGWNDLKIKLPMLLIPMVIGTSRPLEKKIFEYLLLVFVLAVFVSSATSILVWNKIIIPIRQINELRDASLFVPLIRLSLMCALSVFFLGRWVFRVKSSVSKIAAIALIVWFVWFLQFMQSLTGLVILFSGGYILLVVMAFIYRKRIFAISLLVVFVIVTITGGYFTTKLYKKNFTIHPIDKQHLEKYTRQGHPYTFELNSTMIENGNQVMVYCSWYELDSAWNSRSKIELNGGKDVNGNPVSITLIRYLASKGERKDGDAVGKLSAAEIIAIENGATNALDASRSPIEKRLYQVFWEIYHYANGASPSGNSVTMRMELAQTALICVEQHPWIGAGTGAQQKTFATHYKTEGTKLGEQWQWLHSHNQLLSIAVCLGIPGLLYFIFSLWYAPRSMKRWRSYLYLAFFIVFFLSFWDDDTLETSQGVNFFAFFNALFLYTMPRESAIRTDELEK